VTWAQILVARDGALEDVNASGEVLGGHNVDWCDTVLRSSCP
jgi:hypothetical protein